MSRIADAVTVQHQLHHGMIKKVKHILLGWCKRAGLLPVSEAEEKLAQLRLNICAGCRYHKTSQVLEIVNGNAEEVNMLYCKKCTCPCYQKTIVVKEKCPMKFW